MLLLFLLERPGQAIVIAALVSGKDYHYFRLCCHAFTAPASRHAVFATAPGAVFFLLLLRPGQAVALFASFVAQAITIFVQAPWTGYRYFRSCSRGTFTVFASVLGQAIDIFAPAPGAGYRYCCSCVREGLSLFPIVLPRFYRACFQACCFRNCSWGSFFFLLLRPGQAVALLASAQKVDYRFSRSQGMLSLLADYRFSRSWGMLSLFSPCSRAGYRYFRRCARAGYYR